MSPVRFFSTVPLRSLLLVFAVVAASFSTAKTVMADITLSKLFSDHMVLQRQSSLPVWGTATPGVNLTITFAENKYTATADAKGRWSTSIVTGEAGGPFELQVNEDGSELTVGVANILVGDVWICGGQSNMAWPVSKALNPETEIEHSRNFPKIRLFSIERTTSPKPLDAFGVVKPWAVCGPDSVADFSAVGYFFAKRIRKDIEDVPIGLINASMPGSTCEAWISRPALDSVEEFAPLLKHWDESQEVTGPSHPANLYNAMVAPMTRFPVKGVIWYGGEANVGRGHQYRSLFPALIADWRKNFGQPNLPFVFAQLAPFQYLDRGEFALQEAWETQLKTALDVPAVSMAVLLDVGKMDDIQPRNKQSVAQRLAKLALADVYGIESASAARGPMFQSISNQGSKIRVAFSQTGNQLRIGETNPELIGFEICGQDKVFHPASATIVEDIAVEVSSPKVDQPIAVRFGWNLEVTPNLVNESGLPASPFRSDDFPIASEGKHF